MEDPLPRSNVTDWVSTGHLPREAVVQPLVAEAHHRFRPVAEGEVATYIPALATACPSIPCSPWNAAAKGSPIRWERRGDRAVYASELATDRRNAGIASRLSEQERIWEECRPQRQHDEGLVRSSVPSVTAIMVVMAAGVEPSEMPLKPAAIRAAS